MALHQAKAELLSPKNTATVATILPANTPMPLCCDSCEHEQNYTMTQLRQLPVIKCEDCGDTRTFSQFELNIIEGTLNNLGYYLQRQG